MPPKFPSEIVATREIETNLWRLYSRAVDTAPEIKSVLFASAKRAESIYECLFRLWNLLGGTSDIYSVCERLREWQGEMEALQNIALKEIEEKEKNNERYY